MTQLKKTWHFVGKVGQHIDSHVGTDAKGSFFCLVSLCLTHASERDLKKKKKETFTYSRMRADRHP